jgi:hypothetical protein
MTAARSFTLAAKAEVEENEHPPISYELIDPDTGDRREVTAHYPGDGRLTLMLATAGSAESADASDMAVAGEMFKVLQHSFDEPDYRFIRKLVADEKLPLDLLAEMMRDMMERWTAFPTKPSSGSASSPRGTGTRSTGRSPGKGSIQQRSLPVDS